MRTNVAIISMLICATAVAVSFRPRATFSSDYDGRGTPAVEQTVDNPYALDVAADTELSAGETLTSSADVERIYSDGGEVTSTATPFIADAAADGTCIYVQGVSNTNTITVDDDDTTAGTGLQLSGGASFTFALNSTMKLCYDSGEDAWIEASRSSNGSLLTMRISPEAAFGSVDVFESMKTFTTQDGTVLDPVFFYEGGAATATDWDDTSSAAAGNLSINGAGADPTLNVTTVIPNEVGVMFNDANVYEADSTSTGDLADGLDAVLEVVAFIEDVAATQRVMISKGYDSGDSNHWFLYQNTASVVFSVGGVSPIRCLNVAAENATYYKFLLWMDRSGNAQCFANAVPESAVAISGAASASNSRTLVIGGLDTSLQKADQTIIYAALWTCPSGDATCIDSSATDSDTNGIADWQDIAYQRMAKLSGVWPVIGGSDYYLSALSRSSGAYIHTTGGSANRTISYVGAGWPRVEMFDVGGSDYYGHRLEATATNIQTYSEQIDQASWAKSNVTISANTGDTTAPDGTSTAEKATNNSSAAYFYKNTSHSTTNTAYTTSIFAKAGTATWLYVWYDHTSITNPYCYFDLSNAAVGTCGGGASGEATGRIEEYANGWVRVELSYDNTISDTSTTSVFQFAEADGDNSMSSTGLTFYAWGAQDEIGMHASSYIITTSSSATRHGDLIGFTKKSGSIIGSAGTILTELLLPASDPSALAGATRYYWYFDDTGSSDFLRYSVNNSTESGVVMYGSTAYQIQVENFNAHTGAVSSMRLKWQGGNDADVIFNGASQGTDTSFTVPSALTVFYYSGSSSAALSVDGHVGEFQFYNGSYTDEVK